MKITQDPIKLHFFILSLNLGIYEFAESHSCYQLAQCAHLYSVSHFTDVVQCEEFCSISIDHIVKLLSDNSLNVSSEERVFEAAMAWIDFDRQARMVS